MEEYSSTAAFSSLICLLFCKKEVNNKRPDWTEKNPQEYVPLNQKLWFIYQQQNWYLNSKTDVCSKRKV